MVQSLKMIDSIKEERVCLRSTFRDLEKINPIKKSKDVLSL